MGPAATATGSSGTAQAGAAGHRTPRKLHPSERAAVAHAPGPRVEWALEMKPCRIVLTGGPGGGKTTAADLFRRELARRVAVVPESATLLFTGGFPRAHEPEAQRATQVAIYRLQQSLEALQEALHPETILLCDRGTIDGAAYWPDGADGFFEALGTSLEAELARYDGVVFFQSAAVGGFEINGGNPIRTENATEAADLDGRLRALWSKHPRFRLVPHEASFFKKIQLGLATLEQLVDGHAATGRFGLAARE